VRKMIVAPAPATAWPSNSMLDLHAISSPSSFARPAKSPSPSRSATSLSISRDLSISTISAVSRDLGNFANIYRKANKRSRAKSSLSKSWVHQGHTERDNNVRLSRSHDSALGEKKVAERVENQLFLFSSQPRVVDTAGPPSPQNGLAGKTEVSQGAEVHGWLEGVTVLPLTILPLPPMPPPNSTLWMPDYSFALERQVLGIDDHMPRPRMRPK